MVLFLSFISIFAHAAIEVGISPKTQVKMSRELERPLQRGFRLVEELNWYKVKIKCDGKEYQGRIKFHGDLKKHWKDDTKSYDVRIKGGSCYQMTDFSLIIPDDKSHIFEILSQQLSQRLGLISRQIFFEKVLLNSRSTPYLIYEKLIPSALEHAGYPGGFIISQQNAWYASIYRFFSKYHNTFSHSKLEANEFTFSPELYEVKPSLHAGQIKLRFNSFWQALLSSRDVSSYIRKDDFFNYFFIITILGSYHSLLGDNFSYFYDPSSGLFQPLVYDLIVQEVPESFDSHFKQVLRHSFVLKLLFQGRESDLKSNFLKNFKQHLPEIENFIARSSSFCEDENCLKEMTFYRQRLEKNIATIRKW